MTTPEVIARLREGPATMDVRPTAQILDIAGSTLYDSIKRGDAPVRVIKVGTRIKVLTASVIEALGGDPGAVTSREMPTHPSSSEAMPDARTS